MNWSVFIPTLLATFFGVGLAFFINKVYNNYLEKRHCKRLLRMLKDEIALNYNLLKELDDEIKNLYWTPFYDLKFVVWSSIISKISIVFKDINLLSDIAKFYYELQHLNRKINKLFELSFSKSHMKLKEQMAKSIKKHIQRVLNGEWSKSPKEIIEKIDKKIAGED